MFSRTILFAVLFLFQQVVAAQDNSVNSRKIDSLKHLLTIPQDDSSRILTYSGLGFNYQVLDIDSALKYTKEGIRLAREKKNLSQEANLLATLSGIVSQQGEFAEALDLLFQSLKIASDNKYPYDIARAYRRLGGVYFDLENYPKAISYASLALKIDEREKSKSAGTDHIFLANAFEKMNQDDSAAFHCDRAISEKLPSILQTAYRIKGDIYAKKGNYKTADSLFRIGLALSQINADLLTSSEIYAAIARMYMKRDAKDSSLYYALKGFDYGEKVSSKKIMIESGSLIATLYESTQPALAIKYFKIVAAEKDSLFGTANIQTIQNLISHEEDKQKELENSKIAYRNRFKLYGLLSGIIALLIIAVILFRNMKQKQQTNAVLVEQKEKVETALTELKSTQTQLIQSEKMASLGELTAGIAHEIQNPLNFVNNFSEVNAEMADEATAEIDNANYKEAKAILTDIKENAEKISHHGKRADAIVKGMLQHSQSSNGKKEPTDINGLCDEYLRLSYHGLRAKDKLFNATIKTDFDATIEKINIVPQDIGRVILNLVTNAFHAVNEKKMQLTGEQSQESYEPTVILTSKKGKDAVTITVRDNGNGIPPGIIDKIFQPFFTTKPTGQGTGLGLSLAYDIIKAHGGSLKAETSEGEGSTFIIQLPVGYWKEFQNNALKLL